MKYSRSKPMLCVVLAVLAVPVLAVADEGADEGPEERATAVLEAFELPVVTQQLRDAGVEEAQITESLEALRRSAKSADDDASDDPVSRVDSDAREGSTASQAARVLGAEAEAASQYGPLENLGEFVRQSVQEGARGAALADSIRQQREGRSQADNDQSGSDERGHGATEDREARRERRGDGPSQRAEESRDEQAEGQGHERRPDPGGERRGRPDRQAPGDDAKGEESETQRPGRAAPSDDSERQRGRR